MAKRKGEMKNLNYEVFILGLTILSLINFFAVLLFDLSQNTQDVIYTTDMILSFIFLADFTYRLKSAESKKHYFFQQRGWIDLLSSLPLPQVKILRLFRLIRVAKIFRTQGAGSVIVEFFRNRANSAIYIVVFMIFMLLEFGSILLLRFEESNPEAHIQSAGEAMWYVFVTITTVGYGDFTPITWAGRLTGVLVMFVGVGLFGVLTGFLANAFVPPKEESESDNKLLLKEIRDLKKQVDKLK